MKHQFLVLVLAVAVIALLVKTGVFSRVSRIWRKLRDRQKMKRAESIILAGGVAPPPPPPSKFILECEGGHFAGRRFDLRCSVRIGKHPQHSDLVLPCGNGVSGRHCVLMVGGDQIWLKDLGSTYGTFYGSDITHRKYLKADETVRLEPGDRIWLGDGYNVFRILQEEAQPTDSPSAADHI